MVKLSLHRFLHVAFASDSRGTGQRRQHRGKRGHRFRNQFNERRTKRLGDDSPVPLPLPTTVSGPDVEAPPSSCNRLQQDGCHGMRFYNNVNAEDNFESLNCKTVDVEALRAEGEQLLINLGCDLKKDSLRKEVEVLLDGLVQQQLNLKQTRRQGASGILEEQEEGGLEEFLHEASPFLQYYKHELARLKQNISALSRWSGGDQGELDDQDEYHSFLNFYYKDVMPYVVKAGDRDHFPISGNIYMYMALKDFGRSSGLLQTSRATAKWYMRTVRMAGFLVIGLLQIFAPIAIMLYAASPLQMEFTLFDGSFHLFPWSRDDPEWGISFQTQRLLGILFLFLFILNGVFVLRSDREETRKMMHMCRVFEHVAERNDDWDQPQYKWLWVGAVINSVCLLSCALCMFFLFILAAADKGPKDIVFDSLGLTFLYNLDDIGGDLTLLDEEWDEDMMGDIYGGLADNLSVVNQLEEERSKYFTPDNVYQVGGICAQFLLIILPLMFAFSNDIIPKPATGGDGNDEMEQLKATVQSLKEAAKLHGMIL